MNTIPNQFDNPKGLHQRYSIKKLVVKTIPEWDNPNYRPVPAHDEIVEEDVDPNAEYFVLRLDSNGKDPNHINACRIGIQAYANAIEPFIPELAKDLKERYPVAQSSKGESQQGWVDVKDRLPDRINILAFTGGLKITLTYIDGIYYTPDGNVWTSMVTHWMPLPEPPTQTNN